MEHVFDTPCFKELTLTAAQPDLNIRVCENTHVKLIVSYAGIGAMRQSHIELEPGSSLVILMKNMDVKENQLTQDAIVQRDASLTIAYWEIDEGKTDIDLHVSLTSEGSSCTIKSATIAQEHKNFKMECVHETAYTSSLMENYAIVKDGGNFYMEATGKIVKGAHDSASHQATRVLTLSENHNSEVLPVLLIDENDVKASHATTLGQPDENQLYYLQSRGLSRAQALGLLTVGYLMPISELFDDEQYREFMKDEIEKKVGLHA